MDALCALLDCALGFFPCYFLVLPILGVTTTALITKVHQPTRAGHRADLVSALSFLTTLRVIRSGASLICYSVTHFLS